MRNYKIGGKVEISGRWYRITEVGGGPDGSYEKIKTNEGNVMLVREFVEAYIPPQNLDWFDFCDAVEEYMNGKTENKQRILAFIGMLKENEKV